MAMGGLFVSFVDTLRALRSGEIVRGRCRDQVRDLLGHVTDILGVAEDFQGALKGFDLALADQHTAIIRAGSRDLDSRIQTGDVLVQLR